MDTETPRPDEPEQGAEENQPWPRTPEEIVAAADLTVQQKIDRLREMSYDARELDVATEEGMGGGHRSQYDRIARALRELDADDPATDAKH